MKLRMPGGTQKRMISEHVLNSAQAFYDKAVEWNPALRENWLDQCRTSKATEVLGMVRLDTDHDWKVLFLLWYLGAEMERER